MHFKALSVGTALYLMLATGPLSAEEPVDYLDLEDLKVAILVAIKEAKAENQHQEPFFLITDIRLDLKGTEITGVQGGLKIPVFKATASADAIAEYTNSHALVLALAPDAPIATRAVPDIQLSSMVAAVKAAFHGNDEDTPDEAVTDAEGDTGGDDTAADTDAVDGEASAEETDTAAPADDDTEGISLSANRVTYTHSGVLKKKVGGGLNFIFFKIGGQLEQKSLQVIKFELCHTVNKVNCVE